MEIHKLKLESVTGLDLNSLADFINGAYRGESSFKGWTTEADLLEGQRTDPESLQQVLGNPNSMLLFCRKENQIQSCVNLVRHGSKCYLGLLTVSPTQQNSGLGRHTLAAAEDFAKTRWACTQIFMTVITLRTELIAWYERRGYRRTGEFEDFPYGNEKFGRPKRSDLKFEILRKKI